MVVIALADESSKVIDALPTLKLPPPASTVISSTPATPDPPGRRTVAEIELPPW